MTDNTKLIAELDSGCNNGADLPDVLNRAARALEAAEQRITQFEADDRVNWRADWAAQSEELRAERDVLAAVVEQLRDTGGMPVDEVWEKWRAIFATANTDAALKAWHAKQHEGEEFILVGDWLAVSVGHCTCGTPAGALYGHEPMCGTEPVEDIGAQLRERDAEKWDEGLEAGATWTQSTPRGIPVDPPLNPYREGDR